MSLIDEALKRARMEAAQRAAEEEGLPYPTIPRHLGPRRRNRWLLPAVVALAVVGGVLLGALLVSRGGSPAAVTADGAIAAGPAATVAMDSSGSAGGGSDPPDAATPVPAGESLGASRPAEATPATAPAAPRPLPSAAAGDRSSSRAENGSPAAGPPPAATRREPPSGPPGEAAATSTPGAEPGPSEVPSPGPRPAGTVPAPTPPAVPSRPAPTMERPAPPTPPAERPMPSATAVTDRDSGVLLTLPEGPASNEPRRPAENPTEPSFESHAQSVPLVGGGAIELGGIAWSETGPFALINGRVVGPGSVIDGFTLERIRPGHVVLTGEGRRIHLSLR